jgi:hypothetical protein
MFEVSDPRAGRKSLFFSRLDLCGPKSVVTFWRLNREINRSISA